MRLQMLFSLVCLMALSAGCASFRERAISAGESPITLTTHPFSHSDFNQFLRRHVDAQGRIDYERASSDRADLDRYRAMLTETSPDREPERFPTESARLAYWLNAYNASAIALVLDHYPISSVHDVRAPWLFRVLPEGAGFFLFRGVTLGQRRTTLYGLENGLIRKRFSDPRVHFLLNCASASCPRLPAEAFRPDRLEEQMTRETRLFLSESRNVLLDTDSKTLFVSSIFDWYERDFTNWLKRERPDSEASLLSYVTQHLPKDKKEAVRDCIGCRLEFLPYDWSLNDRRLQP